MMKKPIYIIAACALSTAVLCGCGAKATEAQSYEQPTIPRMTRESESDRQFDRREIIIELDGNINRLTEGFAKTPISGVRRRFYQSRAGIYTVEYVHTPQGTEKDDTLDYRLELRDDNTFDFSVTSNGVQAAHYGHWYTRRDEIIMFYDEPISPTAHNVYTCDSMYADILPHGKIMIYDNCNIIVLSREQSTDNAEIDTPNA